MRPLPPEPLPLAFSEQACQDLLTQLIKHEHLSRLGIKLKVWNIRGSYAYYDEREIHISRRALEKNYHYSKALVIHEFAHIVNAHKNGRYRVSSHGKRFRMAENRLLKLFGLSIKRARAYATIIYHNGVEVWRK